MNQPATVQSVDRDLAETTKRYDRAMAQGELGLADLLERDIDGLIELRNDLSGDCRKEEGKGYAGPPEGI